jgi:DNA-binding MarR family transcriptional regulator
LVVSRVYRALRIHAEKNITPSQASALARIEQVEPVRLGVLAQLEGISPASMSKIVESLEAQGLLERITDPLDGRVSKVQISPSGRTLMQEFRAATNRAMEMALASLSEGERRLVEQSLPVLEKISEVLQIRP